MNGVLARIVERRREDLAALQPEAESVRRRAEARCVDGARHRFIEALREHGSPRVIAEIKAASPSAGTIVRSVDAREIAREYLAGGAAAISMVVEPSLFNGSLEWVQQAADASGPPVVVKDFITDELEIDRAVAAGADAILLIAAILDGATLARFITRIHSLGRDALVEVHDERQLEDALAAGARIVGVNNRDLRDFSVDLGRSERLAALMPSDVVRVAESGIRNGSDVARLANAGFDAFLVGESLLRRNDRALALRQLQTV